MNWIRSVALALSIACLTASMTALAQSSGYPKKSGPHGAYDPHAALSSEKLTQVALEHWDAGRKDEAFMELERVIQQYPESGQPYAVRATLYLQQEQLTEALSDLQQALKRSPDNAEALTNRAQVYRRFKREPEALEDLDRAVALQPDLLAARFNRGSLLFGQQKLQDALIDFDHCIVRDPHMAAAYFNRAITKDALGDRNGAVTDLEQFIELSTNPAWKKVAQEQLDAWNGQQTANSPPSS